MAAAVSTLAQSVAGWNCPKTKRYGANPIITDWRHMRLISKADFSHRHRWHTSTEMIEGRRGSGYALIRQQRK